MTDIGKRLRQLREARGLSQGDIEAKTGLLRCYVSRVECGHTVPQLETVEKWAAALGVTMSKVFSEYEIPKATTKPAKRGHLPYYEERLLRLVEKLD